MATFKAPTEAQVREVLRRITTPQLRRAFFEGLKNPLWVAPLANEGAFGAPPEPQTTSDGLIRDVYWPEIEYLIRVAPEAPQEVVDVLLTLARSNNAWLRRGVFAIGAIVPADQAARLKPLLEAWAPSELGWRTDPRDLVRLAINLIQGGQDKLGRWFANVLFRPAGHNGSRQLSVALEDYWYEDGLPQLASALGRDGLSVVLPWLEEYERRLGHFTDTFDHTFMGRGSIRNRGGSYASVEQTLIDVVRDLAIQAMLADASRAISDLLRSNMLLSRKIALFALAEAINRAAVDGEQLELLRSVAGRLLFAEESLDDSCRIEYAELARAVVAVDPESLERLPGLLANGPRVDRDGLRRWLSGDDNAEDVVDQRVAEYIARWRHRWLSSIGADALPEPLRTQLAELDSRFGVLEAPLEPENLVTTWTGPNSPISVDEMSVMSPTELVAHLESWHDTGNGWGPEPSHEGQGRALADLLTTNPKAVTEVDGLVDRLRPTYLRAILRGWEAALKAGLELDWEQTARLVRDVLTHSNESDFPTEGGQLDDELDFRWTKKAAVGLLEELVKKHETVALPEAVMVRLADMLITLADDEKAWSEYASYDNESGMDPLTTSLNSQWPMRVRGLVYLMARGRDASWYEAARAALERELARDDARGASRAVLGEGLGRLLNTDEEWVEQNIQLWFGTERRASADQQIALTTAMAVHHYHLKLYDLLSAPMLALVSAEEPIAVGWKNHQSSPIQRIGEWVIEAVIRGEKTLDDPVAQAFFTKAPANVRGEAIGHIAWSFMHAERVDDAIRDRFGSLWDTRVEHVRCHREDREELDKFFWFVKSKRFDIEWWLPRLKEAAELDQNLAAERYMIGKEIALSADADPRLAFDVLKLLLEGRDDSGMPAYDLTRRAVPMVLARAIASGDDHLKADAKSYMHHLGEKGNLRLEAEVNAVLSGAITQADVDD